MATLFSHYKHAPPRFLLPAGLPNIRFISKPSFIALLGALSPSLSASV